MLNTYFRVIVGTMVLLSVVLTLYVNENWMWFTVFIGVNLIQSAFTKWCLLETILQKLGVKKEAASCDI
jgi:hypothetical protein